MTFIRVSGTETFTYHEIFKLCNFNDMFTALLLRYIGITAVIKSLAKCSKISNQATISQSRGPIDQYFKNPVSGGAIQSTAESNYWRHVRNTIVTRRFPETLSSVKNLNEEPASENSGACRAGLGATQLDNADVLLCIEAVASYTHGRKQHATFTGLGFYSYAASLLRDLRSSHSTACEQHPLTLDVFLLAKTS